ncbi:MAG TPA: aldo/keto reductase [Candidatus Hydrogenedentes bacterium]|jgi:aryl-alcohol dehydrogenase-like predicted oxidoreductase|nr:aldo/keto reductase [Candidatus Hydrogenedentota bacterium]HPJ99518.1 aldo/keto reductase [Candidatus Hydrogenedentota bacterium]
MKYVSFGHTGIRVSPVCLGTMTFGKEADEPTSRVLMDRAFDAGINFFDTANIYNKGLTEEIVGRWLPARRDAIVLASKVHFPTGAGPNERGSSRRHILMEVDKSLQRLQTGWLDILYLHHWDPDTPLEETLAALTTLVDAGKVHYCGVSNFSAWQAMKAIAASRAGGWAPITCIQPMYNLVKRQAEVEILPMAVSERLAVCPYNPLAAGLLTGKYRRGGTGRLDENSMYKDRYADPAYAESASRFVDYAGERGWPPAALAVAWVMTHPAVTSAIIGARNLEQLDETLGCLDISLDPVQRAEISALSIEPPPATDRTEERQVSKAAP